MRRKSHALCATRPAADGKPAVFFTAFGEKAGQAYYADKLRENILRVLLTQTGSGLG
jgi:hypothetical protein